MRTSDPILCSPLPAGPAARKAGRLPAGSDGYPSACPQRIPWPWCPWRGPAIPTWWTGTSMARMDAGPLTFTPSVRNGFPPNPALWAPDQPRERHREVTPDREARVRPGQAAVAPAKWSQTASRLHYRPIARHPVGHAGTETIVPFWVCEDRDCESAVCAHTAVTLRFSVVRRAAVPALEAGISPRALPEGLARIRQVVQVVGRGGSPRTCRSCKSRSVGRGAFCPPPSVYDELRGISITRCGFFQSDSHILCHKARIWCRAV